MQNLLEKVKYIIIVGVFKRDLLLYIVDLCRFEVASRSYDLSRDLLGKNQIKTLPKSIIPNISKSIKK